MCQKIKSDDDEYTTKKLQVVVMLVSNGHDHIGRSFVDFKSPREQMANATNKKAFTLSITIVSLMLNIMI